MYLELHCILETENFDWMSYNIYIYELKAKRKLVIFDHAII